MTTKLDTSYELKPVDGEDPEFKPLSTSNWPAAIKYILVSEFCERFSIFGTLTLLNQYLKAGFGLSVHEAKEVFHFFNGLIYLFTLVGGFLSDSYLAKYRTIVGFSFIYVMGNIMLSIFSINNLLAAFGSYPLWSFLIPVILIAIGSGGIKPCVMSLGADQFNQQDLIDRFFRLFSSIICLGFFLSSIIIPYIKQFVTCGGIPCCSLAFGIPAIFNTTALVFLLMGTRHYKIIPKQGESLLWKTVRAIGFAAKPRWPASPEQREITGHWLNFANEKFGSEFINDLKSLGQVVIVSIPLIFAWMLETQCVTEWQNQYEKMNKYYFGFIYIPTEASGIIYPLLSATCILFYSYLFPSLEQRGIRLSVAVKISLGYFFILLAFLVALILQYQVDQYSNTLVIENRVAVSCTDCLNGAWQLPQWILVSLGASLFSTYSSQLTYIEVGDSMKAFSVSIYFLAFALGNYAVLIMEKILVNSTISLRLWSYWLLSSSFLIVFIILIKCWFQSTQPK